MTDIGWTWSKESSADNGAEDAQVGKIGVEYTEWFVLSSILLLEE